MSGKAPQKNKGITFSKQLISIYIVLLFAFIWLNYYNNFAFRSSRVAGGLLSIFIYYIIYSYLARIYKAFKIGTYQIGEIAFSQFLSIGIANTVLYVECCLIANRYVDILPGLTTTGLQVLGMVLWAVFAKRYFLHHISPSKTLVIYGEPGVEEFVNKLNRKYTHLFAIEECISSDMPIAAMQKKILEYETIMLYEIGNGTRTETMEYCVQHRKNLYITPRISDIIIQGFENRTLIDTPLLKYEYNYLNQKKYHGKRILDVVFSGFFLLLFSIPMAATAFAIKLEDGGPIFYKQKRCTKDGQVFEILKFRSMVVDAEKDNSVIPCTGNDPRITRVGNVIRRFRIDEMPQVFNILKGDMSIVGPRPERVEHVQTYTQELPEFAYRLRVKGGLTGYAQIFGKYNTSACDKLKLDLMYIEKQSLILDLKLIMLTLKIIFIPESTEGFEEEKSKLIGKWDKKMETAELVSAEVRCGDAELGKKIG